MNLKNRKITSEQAISIVTTKLAGDISNLSTQQTKAVNTFRETVNELEANNVALRTSVENFNNLMSFIQEKKAEAERMIANNESVRQKILDIIGEA